VDEISTPPSQPTPARSPATGQGWVGPLVLLAVCGLPLALALAGIDLSVQGKLTGPGDMTDAALVQPLRHMRVLGEWTAVCVGLVAGALAFFQYRISREPSLPVLGIVLVSASAMDGMRALAYVGLIHTAAPPEQLWPFAWTLCRTLTGTILLFGVALVCLPSIRALLTRYPRAVFAATFAVGAAALLWVRMCLGAPLLPRVLLPDAWLPRPFDLYPIAAFLTCALLLHFVYLRQRGSPFAYALLLSLEPQVAAQLYMAFGSWELGDHSANAAHVLKGIGYFVPLLGLLQEYRAAYEGRLNLSAELESQREQLRRTERRAEHDALHDEITGLLNRRALQGRIQHAVAHGARYGHPAAVLFVDLDRFKQVNDSLGHDAGDQVLREVGQRLAHESRASDVTARHSSDEFVVVLYGAQNQDDVLATAEYLRRKLSEPHALAGRAFVITPSIGIALYPHDAADADSLLRHAELAMQAAKSAGGDQVHFYESSMHAAALRALDIERELRGAIERKELSLFYQPYIDLQSGEVVGAEALLRWKHHERGMIPPLDFIPIAERTGLITPIGSWVIRGACAQRASWNATGMPRFPISLNVSAEQFRHEQVGEQLWSALEEFGIDGGDIQCEVTESCLMSDALDACRQLERMRELGVRVSIDDFGTGYSSLSALSQFPIDVLKIDRSFVAGVGDKKKLSIVSAILALAESLGLDTVAEGIETEPQRSLLRELGCSKGQGYLIAKPLPPEEFATWVSARLQRR
jgi:diguanylate cyclase (GGDEF)-like protein